MKSKKVVIAFFFITFSFGLIYGLNNLLISYNEEGNINDNLSMSSILDTHFLEWNFTGEESYPYAITSDASGNFYITGQANEDIYLIKFDSTGHLQWNQTWGVDGLESLFEIALDSANNIYLGGFINDGFNYYRYLLVKFNSVGEYQWNQIWGGSNSDDVYGMALDSIDNVYLVGATHNFTISTDMCLVKFNSLGQYQWNRTWGGNYFDRGNDIVIDPSDNIYITGMSVTLGGSASSVFLLKYNNLGQYLWNTTYSYSVINQGVAIELDSLNNIYIGGSTSDISLQGTDMLLLKYNQSGELLWDRIWGGSGDHVIYDIALDSDDEIYVVGTVNKSAVKGYDFSFNQFDSSGEHQFNLTWGGYNYDIYIAITIDLTDNIYLAGMKDGLTLYIEKYSRDVTPPSIWISSPLSGEIFEQDAPIFNLTIIDINLHMFWYTINDSETKIFVPVVSGINLFTMNQSLWDIFPEGQVSVNFFTNDTFSNINSRSITIVKAQPSNEVIPFGNILVIYITLSAVILIIVDLKKRKLIK